MAELKLSVSEMKELLDKMSALGLQKITVAQGDFTFKAEARQPAQTVCVTPTHRLSLPCPRRRRRFRRFPKKRRRRPAMW